MVEKTLRVEGVVGWPAELRCPAGARERQFRSLWIRTVGNGVAISIFGDVDDAASSSLGEILVRACAVVDVCNNRSALVSSALLELRGDSLEYRVSVGR